jgi:ABC-2 type transport system permease protein
MELLRSLTVILAVVGKEVVETLRRPAAVASLVLGPLVLMLLFGLGYDGVREPLQAVVVVPAQSGLPRDPAAYQPREVGGLEVLAVDADPAAARQGLQDGTVDVIVLAPQDAGSGLEDGQQAEIGVEYATIDPLRAAVIEMLARQISAEANRRIIEQAAAEGSAGPPPSGCRPCRRSWSPSPPPSALSTAHPPSRALSPTSAWRRWRWSSSTCA